ncbi:CLUMA_CG009271, isoform A [Clunio marinus]|uniref:CLUMA_CG009271, isoform A n=1 Tax=Clunio marinus TaxID=568069 RepID=A0A1J1I6J7_9DIPT|nr:CLUMA_CG009271, isoform A [Clunio marinus]
MILVAVTRAAPSPYYTRSLVETPTSRVEQHLLLSPHLQHSQPKHIIPFTNFHFPKHQIVYYQQPQHDGQESLVLHNLNQDMPSWQELWNHYEGYENRKESEQEDSSEKSTNDVMQDSDHENISIADEAKEVPEKDDNDSISVISADHLDMTQPLQNVYHSPHVMPVQRIYTQDHKQFYVVGSFPKFYGNIETYPNSPIFSLQQLQPITRIEDNNHAESQTIVPSQLPSTTTDSSITFRIHVKDESEEENKETNNSELKYTKTPSDNREKIILEHEEDNKMHNKKDKREQLKIEGEFVFKMSWQSDALIL